MHVRAPDGKWGTRGEWQGCGKHQVKAPTPQVAPTQKVTLGGGGTGKQSGSTNLSVPSPGHQVLIT